MGNGIEASGDMTPLSLESVSSTATGVRSALMARSAALLAMGYVLIGVGVAVIISNLVG
jgi:hypothetical protein